MIASHRHSPSRIADPDPSRRVAIALKELVCSQLRALAILRVHECVVLLAAQQL